MIVVAIVSVLFVLIFANIGLKVFNHLYPPCSKSYEYFEGARMLPDGAALALGSIPTSVNLNFVGAQTVATGIPGVIGLKSRNPPIATSAENKKLFAAVNKMFPTSSTTTEKKTTTSSYDGVSSAVFETEMEGLKADSSHRNTDMQIMKPSGFVRSIERDGYSDR